MNLPPPFVPEKSIFRGVGVGAGLAIGPVHIINAHKIGFLRYKLTSPQAIEEELERLAKAQERTAFKIAAARESLPDEFKIHGSIFDAHLLLLNDPFLIGAARDKIREEKINAEAAVDLAVRKIVSVMRGVEDPYIKSRLSDVEIVGQALTSSMHERSADENREVFAQGSVLASFDISPAEVASLPVGRVAALVTEKGSKTSHAAMLAQAIGLPTVVGLKGLMSALEHGDTLIVDAREGHVILNPDQDASKFYQNRLLAEKAYQIEIVRSAHLPAVTLDDRKIDVLGNLELIEELPTIISYGGEGVGLYRTEFLYLSRDKLPDEEELYEVYRRVLVTAAPRQVVIRTLDLGADKVLTSFEPTGSFSASGQALGLRAIRFCLKHPDIFRTQLRAILRASVGVAAKIMFPMISSLTELREVKSFLNHTWAELLREGKELPEALEVGVMIEVPAAVAIVNELALEVDFFSIGTNDLIQYSLAIDRTNPEVAELYRPLHPAIIRMIKTIIDAGKARGISVSVCGDMAAEPRTAVVLAGLGADALSMPSQSIPVIKRLLRMSAFSDIQKLAEDILSVATSEDSQKLVEAFLGPKFDEFL
ncbi:MAG: phosphoenolpyruvate--protein phosphotransferase [Deltaproteobacteria bacterium]|jgi:phosphotransferase system enzyme I (PtsI)|nr:phosphoenolpyruvate--protein phosphotransferase [Deltaproteobacteria bacterium]